MLRSAFAFGLRYRLQDPETVMMSVTIAPPTLPCYTQSM